MVIAPGGYRSNRRTCSNACRIRMYDTRKNEARRMRADGIPWIDIATRLDTSVQQIQKMGAGGYRTTTQQSVYWALDAPETKEAIRLR